jgi:23S rRNA (uridine2552-2'-O)-methyltransferase
LAKARGFRSRASFKLLQVAKRYSFVKRGDHVLDIGCAPGGWLQAAHQLVGGRGFVLGIDLQPTTPLQFENVSTIEADITQVGIVEQIRAAAPGMFDVVLSDLSPNLSGVWEVDHARQIELARCTLRIARSILKPGGDMLVKVFQGPELREFQLEMKSSFDLFRIVKPAASRPESAELYLLGLGFLRQVTQQGT